MDSRYDGVDAVSPAVSSVGSPAPDAPTKTALSQYVDLCISPETWQRVSDLEVAEVAAAWASPAGLQTKARQLWRISTLARCLAALKWGAWEAWEARIVTAQLQQALEVSRQRAILAKMRREHCTVTFDVWWHYWAEQRWLKRREYKIRHGGSLQRLADAVV